ncbi:MAG TPA: PIG-L family deacetylase, partial [Thermoanaerobaculia bacterium]|nr:PIG-L family deacetylase [Thermoanaerobaculia bacterium]
MTSDELPDERALVPYEASRFDARRVLVLAPHPDDEVFGCGGALADLASRGATIDVLLVTDGAASTSDEAG